MSSDDGNSQSRKYPRQAHISEKNCPIKAKLVDKIVRKLEKREREENEARRKKGRIK